MENERSHSIRRARRRGRNWGQMLINLRRVSPRPCTSTVWTSIQLCSELCRQESATFVCFRDELHSASSCSLLGSTTEHRILSDKGEEKDEEEPPKRESGVIHKRPSFAFCFSPFGSLVEISSRLVHFQQCRYAETTEHFFRGKILTLPICSVDASVMIPAISVALVHHHHRHGCATVNSIHALNPRLH
jgi:hypothetical protein